ncbi:hypothetical protein BSZ39_12430 [Bowdeniella nasicola]|uniref:Glycosyl transferase family 2 n=2 Tax=Bowdeniella nasicola TaxID=208480 RepID=A0A1Q5PZW5_9ACTO|nr:hypothetical protein BSZ39_12430 [Bowdeniella nasicola]
MNPSSSDVLRAARQAKHALFLKSRDVKARRQALSARASFARTGVMRTIRESVTLPRHIPSGPEIWGIAMVKNEVDIIEDVLRHNIDQGLDAVLILDNGSSDGTRELLGKLSGELPIYVGDDPIVAYEQSAKMTFLADTAAQHRAEWIVPFDADEFWFGVGGSLNETLKASTCRVERAWIYNVFPQSDGLEWQFDPTRHFDPKVAFRPQRGAVLHVGNHSVSRTGAIGDQLRILHKPWRSKEQFFQKIRQGAKALEESGLPEDKGYHWRHVGAKDDSAQNGIWEDLLSGKVTPDIAWYPRGTVRPFPKTVPPRWDDVLSQEEGE